MGILNPVVSKVTLSTTAPQEIYFCPNDKSHAIVDLGFFKDNLTDTVLIAVALTTESNPANLTTVDYFIDDIELIGTVNIAQLNKVIVGRGERLVVRTSAPIETIVRLSGVEEVNAKVARAGRLVATSVPNTAQTQLFTNALPNISYISCSVTVFNTSTTANAEVEVWVTTAATPAVGDKILRLTIPTNDMTILENLLLTPNERIFVRSSIANTEYFVNGMVISV